MFYKYLELVLQNTHFHFINKNTFYNPERSIHTIPMNHFSRNIKHYRKLHNLTQQQLADKVGISHQALSFYENGIRECKIDYLIKFADVFGISVDELVR
ncbi:helix-turn-helix transcriptional regulator [Schaedlerella arabinosiphila]|uniref:Helix-turn-helix transcriptional regulator n=1 Tax=Schaedlerella arabinosiphila TaxID=2044587 RepID=A0A9X5H5S1_9FIRM|nr:helix-turn-helix transcriptional regulator [Schaedlerella arabinosiphila]